MSILTKKSAGKEFAILSADTHLAVCSAVVAVGLQETNYGDKDIVHLRFEVPAERDPYFKNGVEFDEPVTIWPAYTNSHHEMAKLRQHLEAWLGRNFTPEEEVNGFDLSRLVGKPAIITVAHNKSGEKTFANVTGIAKPLKDQLPPIAELPFIIFGPDDTDQYDDLPKWLQAKFDTRLPDPEPEVTSERGKVANDFHEDPIPF